MGWAVRDRIPVGARFSAPVQTGPGAHPAFYKMGAGSFLGVKRPVRSVDHPPHLVPRLKKEYSYTSTPPLGLRGLLYCELYLYLYSVPWIFLRNLRLTISRFYWITLRLLIFHLLSHLIPLQLFKLSYGTNLFEM